MGEVSRFTGSWVDPAKLDIRDGVIFYKLYGQDGKFIPMQVADNDNARRMVAWIQMHDRYTGAVDENNR